MVGAVRRQNAKQVKDNTVYRLVIGSMFFFLKYILLLMRWGFKFKLAQGCQLRVWILGINPRTMQLGVNRNTIRFSIYSF